MFEFFNGTVNFLFFYNFWQILIFVQLKDKTERVESETWDYNEYGEDVAEHEEVQKDDPQEELTENEIKGSMLLISVTNNLYDISDLV